MNPPLFSAGNAQLVSPYRHEPTARTVARHQPAEDKKNTHLFSATGVFIATVPTTEAAAAAEKAAAAAKSASAAAKSANDKLHSERLAAAKSS